MPREKKSFRPIYLRLPPEVADAIVTQAGQNMRTINAEALRLLQLGLSVSTNPVPEARVTKILQNARSAKTILRPQFGVPDDLSGAEKIVTPPIEHNAEETFDPDEIIETGNANAPIDVEAFGPNKRPQTKKEIAEDQEPDWAR